MGEAASLLHGPRYESSWSTSWKRNPIIRFNRIIIPIKFTIYPSLARRIHFHLTDKSEHLLYNDLRVIWYSKYVINATKMLQILFRIYHRVFSRTMRKFKLLYQEYYTERVERWTILKNLKLLKKKRTALRELRREDRYFHSITHNLGLDLHAYHNEEEREETSQASEVVKSEAETSLLLSIVTRRRHLVEQKRGGEGGRNVFLGLPRDKLEFFGVEGFDALVSRCDWLPECSSSCGHEATRAALPPPRVKTPRPITGAVSSSAPLVAHNSFSFFFFSAASRSKSTRPNSPRRASNVWNTFEDGGLSECCKRNLLLGTRGSWDCS